jgi:hypothetical protein
MNGEPGATGEDPRHGFSGARHRIRDVLEHERRVHAFEQHRFHGLRILHHHFRSRTRQVYYRGLSVITAIDL